MSEIPSRKEIGSSLQQLRIQAGFSSAKAFANELGINPDTYTGYEQGKGMFTYERAWKIADALHCSLDELGGREWPRRGGPPAYADARQRRLNEVFESVNEEGRAKLADDADTMAKSGKFEKGDAASPGATLPRSA